MSEQYKLFVPDSHENCTLANFDWAGKAALKVLVEEVVSGKSKKGFILIGNPGVGKSHILVAIFRELLEKGKVLGSDILFLEFCKFVTESMDMCKIDGLLPENVVDQIPAKIMIIDDVRPHWSGKFAGGILRRMIESAYENGKILIMSTNAENPDDLVKVWNIEDYYASRLAEIATICLVKGKDWRVEKK